MHRDDRHDDLSFSENDSCQGPRRHRTSTFRHYSRNTIRHPEPELSRPKSAAQAQRLPSIRSRRISGKKGRREEG